MSQQSILRAAVLYNCTRKEYVIIDPQTTEGNPESVTWTWSTSPMEATRWVNIIELQYFLTDTSLGNPTNAPYPWEVQWMYFHS